MIDNQNKKFNYEIDFLPVGNGRSGDAIALRWWDGEWSEKKQKVMVIDGGTKESGRALVKHIKKYYKTDYVNCVVNTHPDEDHASGLTEVLEKLKIGELWMHRPWEHIEEIVEFANNPNSPVEIDGRTTINSLKKKFENCYPSAKELEKIAESKRIKIKEPYAGSKIGDCFTVLSPAREWHLFELIPSSQKVKEKTNVIFATESFSLPIDETMENETLRDYEETSRENESSVILYGNLGNGGILFTGDAGKEALNEAYQYAQEREFDIATNLSFIQIPHHGSKRNIEPKILNHIVGKPFTNKRNTIAYVSCGENDEKHPAKIVVNAFIRRGCKVIATQGSTKRHSRGDVPAREGWTTAKPLEFSRMVESYD